MSGGVDVELDSDAIADFLAGPEVMHLMAEVGEVVTERARALAPKKTGRGAAAINHEEGRDDEGPFTNIGYDDPQAFYMEFQELGTSHAAARPHLRPAINEDVNL